MHSLHARNNWERGLRIYDLLRGAINRQRNAVNRRDWTARDNSSGCQALTIIKLGWLAWWLSIQQAARALRVEPQHPVPHDLQATAADLGRLGAGVAPS